MSNEITFNGDDLSTLGWSIVGASGMGDLAALVDNEVELYGRSGVYLAGIPRALKRQIRVTLLSDRFATIALLDAAMKALSNQLSPGLTRLTWAHRPGQYIDAALRNSPFSLGNAPEFVAPYRAQITLDFDCPDPYWTDIEARSYLSIVGITPSVDAMPLLGTAVSTPIIRVTGLPGSGSLVSPYVAIIDQSGNEVSRITFNETVAAQSTYVIDVKNRKAWCYYSGTTPAVSANAAILIGSTWPSLDPAHGAPGLGMYPFVRVGAASGSPHAETLLHRRWS